MDELPFSVHGDIAWLLVDPHYSGEMPWVLHLKLTGDVTSSVNVLGCPASMPAGLTWSEDLVEWVWVPLAPGDQWGWTGRTQPHTLWKKKSSSGGSGSGAAYGGGWASLFLGAQPRRDPPPPLTSMHWELSQLLSACSVPGTLHSQCIKTWALAPDCCMRTRSSTH